MTTAHGFLQRLVVERSILKSGRKGGNINLLGDRQVQKRIQPGTMLHGR